MKIEINKLKNPAYWAIKPKNVMKGGFYVAKL